jgi:hypothetical protein
MENSNDIDYVSEKVYDALEAGCIPIYYGAPNVDEFIPEAASIVNLAKYNNLQALLDELERLSRDETAYQEKLAWKKKPLQQLSSGAPVPLLRPCSAGLVAGGKQRCIRLCLIRL